MNAIKKSLLAASFSAVFSTPALAEGNLNLYVWAESIDPKLIEAFEKETNIDVNVDGYTSNEDLLAKLKTGATNYDLVMPSQHFVRIMIQENLLKDIDADQMAAFQQVDERWRKQWWDEQSQYSIPFAYGTAGFAYHSEKYTGPTDSWGAFFEPASEMSGKIAVFSTPDEVIPAAQLYLGVPFCSENGKEMKKVYELLAAQKDKVAVYSSDNIDSRLASGEVLLHNWWDGEVLKARKNEGAPVKYAMPKEGLVGWIDSFVVPATSNNVDNAKTFIDWISRVDQATQQFNYYSHSSPVQLDESKVVHNKTDSPDIFPDVPVHFTQACSPKAQKLVDKVWTQLLQ